jgi:hypothetical protein
VSIDALVDAPGDTGVVFSYQLANELTGARLLRGSWTPFLPGARFPPDTTGRYLQVFIELLPDGSGDVSPRVSNLSVRFERRLPPYPPSYVTTAPEDGAVVVSWRKAQDSDVAGYLVYYGERPGQYFGADGSLGASPIDVGNVSTVRIDGLTNGKLYYFAVVSYDRSRPPHTSEFSPEKAERPARIFGSDS